jgi:hypothetical protein
MTCRKVLDLPLEMDWLKASALPRFADSAGETPTRVDFDLAFEKQPYAVSLKLSSNRPFQVEKANVRYTKGKNRLTVNWQYFPDRVLKPGVELRLPGDASLSAEVRAVFLETPVRVVASGENKYFVQRAEVVRRLEIRNP